MAAKASFILKCIIIVLCSFSILSSLSIPPQEDYTRNNGHQKEEYDPSYFLKFQSVGDIIADADKHFGSSAANNLEYYNYVAEVVRKRFYHGYSYYGMKESPIAFISSKIFWNDLNAIVIPDDIMKHPMAACSQQAIVLMEIFKRKKVDFRKVTFDHHFTVEAMIENKWRYFDTDIEPNFKNKRLSLDELLTTKEFDSAYSPVVSDLAAFHKMLGKPRYSKVNQFPAPQANLFHRLTFFLNSIYVLFACLVLMILSTIKWKPVTKKSPATAMALRA